MSYANIIKFGREEFDIVGQEICQLGLQIHKEEMVCGKAVLMSGTSRTPSLEEAPARKTDIDISLGQRQRTYLFKIEIQPLPLHPGQKGLSLIHPSERDYRDDTPEFVCLQMSKVELRLVNLVLGENFGEIVKVSPHLHMLKPSSSVDGWFNPGQEGPLANPSVGAPKQVFASTRKGGPLCSYPPKPGSISSAG